MTNSFLMRWICDDGHQNWAYEFDCQECGLPRNSKARWFLPDPMIEASDAQEKLKGKGPNWICASCDSVNPDYETENCKNCGAPIGKAKTNKRIKYPSLSAIPRRAEDAVSFEVIEVDYGDAGQGFGPSEVDPPKQKPIRSSTQSKVTVREYPRSQSLKQQVRPIAAQVETNFFKKKAGNSEVTFGSIAIGLSILIAVSLIIFAIWYNYFDTNTKSAWVTSLGWTNNTRVDQFMEVEKTDWDENVPSDAYNSSCTWKVREKDHKVSDGIKNVDYETTCTVNEPVACPPEGDGAGGVKIPTGCTEPKEKPCTKTRPEEQFHLVDISDYECTYNVMRWQKIGDFYNSGVTSVIPASGNSHETPYDHGGYVDIPNQIRITEELGTYTVNFSSEFVEPFSFNYDYETWLQFDLKDKVMIEVNRKGTVPYKPEVYVPR